MATIYTETPINWSELAPYVNTDTTSLVKGIFGRRKCFFYDTCSFRRHANLQEEDARKIAEYIKSQDGCIVITRCILMELASHSGMLNQEYIQYCRCIRQEGIDILLIYEEDIFAVMEICYSTITKINSLLTWSVRMLRGPVSTITKVLDENSRLKDEVLKGRCVNQQGMYKRFFSEVRANKEAEDNLGEELLGICLHILSQLTGEEDGKFCLLTDDKGAASKVDAFLKKTNKQHRGKRIIIFSTPKLVQTLYAEGIIVDQTKIITLLRAGTSGNIRVLATQIYDLRSREITLRCEELANLILMQEIHITF